jgi:hypothetical protein
VASGHIIWDHIVVTEPLEGMSTGLYLSVTAHVISLSAKMVIRDSSDLLSQLHGEDASSFTMSVVSVAVEHMKLRQTFWKLKLYLAKFCCGIHDYQAVNPFQPSDAMWHHTFHLSLI